MKQTIADRIKKLAANPVVQENRRKLKAIAYLYDKNPGEYFLDFDRTVLHTPAGSSIPGWAVTLYKNDDTCTCIEQVALCGAIDLDSCGDRPIII